jgi:hypothetical protein
LLVLGCGSDEKTQPSPSQPKDSGVDASVDGSSTDSGSRSDSGPPEGGAPDPDATVIPPSDTCLRVRSTELRARKTILSQKPGGSQNQDQTITITKAALYGDFVKSCGLAACHGGGDKPNEQSPTPFKFTEGSFGDRDTLGSEALERILNSDPIKVMPPGSGDGSKRREDDPIRVLGEQLKLWQEAGFPDQFDIVIRQPPDEGNLDTDPYLMGTALGESLTNIGSCLPTAKIEHKLDEMETIDDMFASVQTFDDLPDTLNETDLVSLDSEVLARRGVYSYAPTYMLFSDNAEKMRYVRVPVGTSITYNPQTKEFDVPENTRFYKTFLKKVIDKNGEVGYRKMETRLIVSRHNEELPDGTFRPKALKVVYAWDQDERMARKVTDPLRSGQPWSDRLCPYVTDESKPRDPQKNPIIERVATSCTYMTADEMQDPNSGTIRHYAIPSTERCDQCHMGSHSRSYILGFTPYHADRRAPGEGGIFEDPADGEEDQLKRLIEYGVVTGIEPGEAKLEESQGDRKPRNNYELTAQGYMMGNCSFCHNPNGFPTQQNPVLGPFDLFPSDVGGIFQFPLEKFSSRAKFGVAQQVRYPYITPAFGNHPNGSAITSAKVFSTGEPSPVVDLVPDVSITGAKIWKILDGAPDVKYSRFDLDTDGTPKGPEFTFLGPWRSLIWRNVYTPFTYSEDNAIFIHMPRNVPGYDCRAQKIMADWMLSIPSKDCRNLDPEQVPVVCEGKEAVAIPGQGYNLDQPFEEVLPSSPDYKLAARDGEKRVEAFNGSVTAQNCPTDDDIVDPKVVLSPKILGTERKEYMAPQDQLGVPPNGDRVVKDAQAWAGISDGVPDHPHWVPVDNTDNYSQGWTPRRSNWEAVIAERSVPVSNAVNAVIDQLQGFHLSDEQRDFSERLVPMGLWRQDCWTSTVASGSRTVVELQNTVLKRGANDLRDLELWVMEFDSKNVPLPPLAPVHSQSRGEAVFRAICQNCHGRSADSRSPLASTIGELTGGETRVANFVDGILGPKAAPGTFAEDAFRINHGATPADWQVRYMLFMGLGGTESVIPEIAISLVKTSPFYGIPVLAGNSTGANMLQAASGKCNDVLNALWDVDEQLRVHPKKGRSTFLAGTGEYELWEALCGYHNEPVVRVLNSSDQGEILFTTSTPILYRAQDDSGAWIYPTDHPVGNRLGKFQKGIQPDNYLPWCVRPTNEVSREKLLEIFEAQGVSDALAPICPEQIFATAFGGKELYRIGGGADAFDNSAFVTRVNNRGAMNAGTAAYYYLDGITKGTLTPSPAFDSCKDAP